MNTRSFLLSALLAGLFIALFGNIPVINLVNCILCLWVWLGGALAVYLYQRFQRGGAGLSGGQGALLGAVSGLVGAVIGLPLYLVFSSVLNKLFSQLIDILQIQGGNPFRTGTGTSILVQGLIWFFFNLVLYAIFGAVSGLITASLLWKKAPSSQAVIDIPPAAPFVETPPAPAVSELPVVETPPAPSEAPAVEPPSEWQAEVPPEPPADVPPESPASEAPPEPPAI
jgi:hypothetical protein